MLPQDLTDLLIKSNILYISPSPPCLPEDHPIHTPQSLDLVFHTARGSYMFMDYCRPPTPAPEQLRRMGSGASVVLDPTPEAEVEVESSLSSSSLSSRRLPCSRYKGVVPQPNGRWGAQIYERHQRVWLGTYGDQASAARAYDVAAQRFRGRDAATNFAPLSDASDDGALALAFLAAHSKAEIVDMLRKHTYYDELQQGKKRGYATGGVRRRQPGCCGSAPREILFDKVVTPSDVGKLNRLVIPKQHAEKHFPLRRSGGVGADDKGVLLGFEDAEGRLWRFRYSYWNSSQSYVLTKGWIRFVKEKRLRAGDVICFWQSTGPEKQLYIDRKAAGLTTAPEISCIMQAANNVRLFGVNISELPPRASNGKRAAADMELLPPPLSSSSKKLNQCCVKDDDL